jgi:outer membrane protein TolC
VEVASELNSLQTSREQVEIAQTTVEQAKESYRIRHNRYEQGMERMSDLLSAEATLSQSKLQLASALFNYNVQVAKLELLLEKNLAD